MGIKKVNLRVVFYSIWFILLIFQAYFTELIGDEAYYWKYSQNLDWGYFDHPPVIAFIIKIGYSIFQNELGVRLLSVIISLLTVATVEKILKPKDNKLFFAIISSIGLLHFLGFLAIPDSPFLLASCCFFLAYRKYLFATNLKNALILSLTISFMILSKYHGLLVVGFTVASNLKFIKNKYFWIILFASVLIITPHAIWQINNGFPSLNYHLYERSKALYSINFTLEYLLAQAFIFGPFLSLFLIVAYNKFKAKTSFQKTIKWNILLTYVFFLIMTFKGRVEAHWTIMTLLPSVYIVYNYLNSSHKAKKIFYYLFPVSIVLIILSRIFLISDFLPSNKLTNQIKTEFHGKKQRIDAIKSVAKNTPVFFMNSYQNAALYEFYSEIESGSLNNIVGRKNQYTILNTTEKYRGKKIMVITNANFEGFPVIPYSKEKIQYKFVNNFQPYDNLKLSFDDNPNFKDSLTIYLRENDIKLNQNSEFPAQISYQFFKGDELISDIRTKVKLENNKNTYKIKVDTPKEKGRYKFAVSVYSSWLPSTINSEFKSVYID